MTADGLRNRLRAALPAAMRQRDAALVALLRETLAALDNAEAVPGAGDDPGSLALEATPVGAGAREVARRELSDEARRLREQADALAAIAGEGSGPDRR